MPDWIHALSIAGNIIPAMSCVKNCFTNAGNPSGANALVIWNLEDLLVVNDIGRWSGCWIFEEICLITSRISISIWFNKTFYDKIDSGLMITVQGSGNMLLFAINNNQRKITYEPIAEKYFYLTKTAQLKRGSWAPMHCEFCCRGKGN